MSNDQRGLHTYRRRIEAAAIGGLIIQPAALDEVRHWLEATDFAHPHYGDWYSHLLDMRDDSKHIDQVTLLAALRRGDQLGPQGQHADELATITMATPVPASTVEYCHNVLEESIRDQVAAVGVRLTQVARTPRDIADTLTQATNLAQQDLHRVAERHFRAEHRQGAAVAHRK